MRSSLVGLWLLAIASGFGCGGRPPERVNLVMISLDTCRADALSFTGNQEADTPNLDALAGSGTWFETAVSPVPITLPAHCSLMTGTNPPRHGVRDNLTSRLTDEIDTLAEILAAQGWSTAGFVSSYVLHRRFGFAQGFQTFDDDFSDSVVNVFGAERRGEETVGLAVEWLEKADQRPFFLFVHLYDPHEPYSPPEPFASRFSNMPYLGEVAYADHCVGRLIEAIDRLGLSGSTIITVVGDHGEMLGEHGELTHTYFIYRNAVRVPMLLAGPGIPTGRRITRLTGLVDVMPTLCDVLGIPAPDSVQGVSAASWLATEKQAIPEPSVYCESLTPTRYGAAPLYGMITTEFKLIESLQPELYDHRADPEETSNLAAIQSNAVGALRIQISNVLNDGLLEPAPAAALDADERRRLEALGYVAADSNPSAESPIDNQVDATTLISVHVAHQLAIQHLAAGEYDEAEPHCETVLNALPEFWEGVSNLAKVLVGQRRWHEAKPILERANALHPDQYEILFDLGLVATELGRLDTALEYFQRALPHDPTPPAGALNLARALVAAGRASEAEPHLETIARSSDVGSIEASSRLLFEMGRIDDAADQLTEVLRLRPGDESARLSLASIRLRQHRDAEATSLFDEFVRRAAEPAEATERVVELAARAGRYDLAGRYLDRRAVESQTATHHALGMTALGRGDIAVALRELESASRLEPDRPMTLNALGLACALAGDLSTARRHFSRVLELDPQWAGAHLNLGMVALNSDRGPQGLELAIGHFEQAIAIDPTMAEAHANLGMANLRLGRIKDAVPQLHRSLDLAPDQPSILDQLAWLHATSQDPEVYDPTTAVELASRACEVTKRRQPELLATLAIALERDGRREQAKMVAVEALRLARSQGQPEVIGRLQSDLGHLVPVDPS